jgi:arylsulfatase A-like enzyme
MNIKLKPTLLCLGLLAGSAAASEKPNILFVLVDDQRNDSLGCAGHPVLQTPNIDRLAEQGVRFENAFATTAICMASRATIFTGLTETGHGYTGGPAPATPVIQDDLETSFPVLLREAGYRIGFFGKQHVKFKGGNKDAMKRMFDESEVIHRNPYFKKQPDGSLRHTAELIGDRSVGFLESQNGDQPFCLYMSFNISHAEDKDHRPGIGHFPWPKAVDGLYEDHNPEPPRLGDEAIFESLPEFMRESLNRERWYWRWDTPEKYAVNMRAYYRMLTGMDGVLGRVFQTLEKQGLADNTIIIYTADNGFYRGDRGFAGKWSHYEQSLRIPLIVFDPRAPEALRGQVVEPMALNLDLPSTMLQMAGVAVPEKYQGLDLSPVLKGSVPEDWRTDFMCEHHYNHPKIPQWYGVRDERYVYARYYNQDPPYEFLHDLKTDPDQLKNLSDNPECRAVLEKMRGRCDELIEDNTRPEIAELKNALNTGVRKVGGAR